MIEENSLEDTSPTQNHTNHIPFKKIDLSTINPVEETSIMEPAYFQHLDSTNTYGSQWSTMNLDFKPRPGNGLDYEIF